jgi:sialate O-acetylesterase
MHPYVRLSAGFALAVWVVSAAYASITLPSIFGDHMVLQQKQAIPVWGVAQPHEPITVALAHRSATTTAGPDGQWRVELGPVKAGGPYTLLVQGASDEKRFEDVLVGEVWLCGGQSNMEWPVTRSNHPNAEIAAANYPAIRFFMAERIVATEPQDDVAGQWQVCSPETIGEFSAVAYYFGRTLYRELDLPVGLIKSAWGGTPAESWTTWETLTATPEFKPLLDTWDLRLNEFPEKQAAHEAAVKAWEAAGKPAGQQPRPPMGPNHPHRPASLYNGMIAPLKPYGIRGAIWYQGESNVGRAEEYSVLFPKMIEDWRRVWGQGDFPFYFVQLANYLERKDTPQADSAWAALREAQMAALALPNTGVAVAIDIGEADDIHPRNKQDVGKRLALNALRQTYGKRATYMGPKLKAARVKNGNVILTFAGAGGLTTADGAPVKGFALAGADGNFVWAQGQIKRNKVVLSAPGVDAPEEVLYGWADNPHVNLVNAAGLPAVPFRAELK